MALPSRPLHHRFAAVSLPTGSFINARFPPVLAFAADLDEMTATDRKLP